MIQFAAFIIIVWFCIEVVFPMLVLFTAWLYRHHWN